MLLQHGLIAGGLADGSIAIWDAQQILKGRAESALLAKEAKHHGAVSTPALQSGMCCSSLCAMVTSACWHAFGVCIIDVHLGVLLM